ncbi:MAG TPA: hypothetical protein HPP56_03210 [Nitrospirae bacterium]|nr:hypothetical protein [Nitrospirota bacterium]
MFIHIQIIFYLLFFSLSTSFAQSESKAIVRAGKHPDYIRVVFTAPIDILNKSSVVLQSSGVIKIDLKSVKNLDVQPIGLLTENSTIEIMKGLKISSKDNLFFISYENIDDISVSKLSNPPRLVIDIYSFTKKSTEEPGKIAEIDKELKEPIVTQKIDTLLLDAGHGGDDKGLLGSSFSEKDLTLSFVKELSTLLNKGGKKVILTRRQDHLLTLKERNGVVKTKKYDLLISIHVSSRGDLLIYSLNKKLSHTGQSHEENAIDYKDKLLVFSEALGKELENVVTVKSVDIVPTMFLGIKRLGFLIELPNPNKFNYDRKNKERLISAIVKAVNSIE